MVIAHAVNGIVALIRAGGDAGRIREHELDGKLLGIRRVFHTGDPAAAVGLCADDADIAADIEHIP